jgi:hypothetical protein
VHGRPPSPPVRERLAHPRRTSRLWGLEHHGNWGGLEPHRRGGGDAVQRARLLHYCDWDQGPRQWRAWPLAGSDLVCGARAIAAGTRRTRTPGHVHGGAGAGPRPHAQRTPERRQHRCSPASAFLADPPALLPLVSFYSPKALGLSTYRRVFAAAESGITSRQPVLRSAPTSD